MSTVVTFVIKRDYEESKYSNKAIELGRTYKNGTSDQEIIQDILADYSKVQFIRTEDARRYLHGSDPGRRFEYEYSRVSTGDKFLGFAASCDQQAIEMVNHLTDVRWMRKKGTDFTLFRSKGKDVTYALARDQANNGILVNIRAENTVDPISAADSLRKLWGDVLWVKDHNSKTVYHDVMKDKSCWYICTDARNLHNPYTLYYYNDEDALKSTKSSLGSNLVKLTSRKGTVLYDSTPKEPANMNTTQTYTYETLRLRDKPKNGKTTEEIFASNDKVCINSLLYSYGIKDITWIKNAAGTVIWGREIDKPVQGSTWMYRFTRLGAEGSPEAYEYRTYKSDGVAIDNFDSSTIWTKLERQESPSAWVQMKTRELSQVNRQFFYLSNNYSVDMKDISKKLHSTILKDKAAAIAWAERASHNAVVAMYDSEKNLIWQGRGGIDGLKKINEPEPKQTMDKFYYDVSGWKDDGRLFWTRVERQFVLLNSSKEAIDWIKIHRPEAEVIYDKNGYKIWKKEEAQDTQPTNKKFYFMVKTDGEVKSYNSVYLRNTFDAVKKWADTYDTVIRVYDETMKSIAYNKGDPNANLLGLSREKGAGLGTDTNKKSESKSKCTGGHCLMTHLTQAIKMYGEEEEDENKIVIVPPGPKFAMWTAFDSNNASTVGFGGDRLGAIEAMHKSGGEATASHSIVDYDPIRAGDPAFDGMKA